MVNRRDFIIGSVIFGGLLVILVLSLVTVSIMGTGRNGPARRSIGVVDITGAIIDPESTVDSLERLGKERNIVGVVLRLNTPGGGVAATQEIHSAIQRIQESGKPVLASMGTVAASGGYYIASACDSIIALPGSITGSIGTITTYADISALLEKIGIDFTVIKSGVYKDTGSPFRDITEEERELIRELIMDIYNQFVSAVAEGRGVEPERIRELADGRVFSGRQAQDVGLVDVLGTYRDALEIAGVMTGLGPDPPVFREREDLFRRLFLRSFSRAIKGGIQEFPVVDYMWSR